MRTLEVKVTSVNGLNSRQAAELVAEANRFKSASTVVTSKEKADLKSIMDVMDALVHVVHAGENFQIEIEGEDEEKAYDAFRELLNTVRF